jgi:hypothetical protein
VALVRTDFSEKGIASIITVTGIGGLETLVVTSNRSTLMMEAKLSSETSVLTRATQQHIPEDGILHSQRRGNLRYYIPLTGWAMS